MDLPSPFDRYLNTNDPLSDSELRTLKHIVEEHEASAAALTAKIEETEKALARMKAQHLLHNKFVKKHRPLLSPIRHIPNDILALVFLECLSDDQTTCNSPRHPVILLSRVSREWRALALRTPRLWSHIRIDIPGLYKNYYTSEARLYEKWCRDFRALRDSVKAWISRSSQCPIKLELSGGFISEQMESCYGGKAAKEYELLASALLTACTRWEEVECTVYLGPIANAAVTLFGANLECPLLQRVSLDVDYAEINGQPTHTARAHMQALTTSKLFTAPKLRDFEVSGFWGNIGLTKSGLGAPAYESVTNLLFRALMTEEDLDRFNGIQAINLLKLLPNLVTLEMHFWSSPPIEVEAPPVSLPRLSKMVLYYNIFAEGFGPSLDLPQLLSLHLKCYQVHEDVAAQGDSDGQAQLLLQYARQLEAVTLPYGSIPRSSVSLCLEQLSNLVTLVLNGRRSEPPSDELDVFVLSQLSLPHSCPQLQELTLSGFSNVQEQGSTEQGFVDLLAVKRRRFEAEEGGRDAGGHCFQVWRRLRRVVVTFQYAKKMDIPEAVRSRDLDMDGMEVVIRYQRRWPSITLEDYSSDSDQIELI